MHRDAWSATASAVGCSVATTWVAARLPGVPGGLPPRASDGIVAVGGYWAPISDGLRYWSDDDWKNAYRYSRALADLRPDFLEARQWEAAADDHLGRRGVSGRRFRRRAGHPACRKGLDHTAV